MVNRIIINSHSELQDQIVKSLKEKGFIRKLTNDKSSIDEEFTDSINKRTTVACIEVKWESSNTRANLNGRELIQYEKRVNVRKSQLVFADSQFKECYFLIAGMEKGDFWGLDHIAIKKMAHPWESGITINFTKPWLRKTFVKQLMKEYHLNYFKDYGKMINWLIERINTLYT